MALDIIDDSRYDTAVYWAPKGRDDHGHPTYFDPKELTPGVGSGGVRWVDSAEMIVGKAGEEIRSRAVVSPGEDLEEDGVLWHGKLEDIPEGGRRLNPFLNKRALAIQRFVKVPTVEGDQFYRVAYL